MALKIVTLKINNKLYGECTDFILNSTLRFRCVALTFCQVIPPRPAFKRRVATLKIILQENPENLMNESTPTYSPKSISYLSITAITRVPDIKSN